MNLIDGATYIVTTTEYDGEPPLTIEAVWNAKEQVFDSDYGWLGLDDVTLITKKFNGVK